MNIKQYVGTWMKENARPVELARYRHLFQNGSKEEYLDELKKYQTSSGGFAHGLEPDFLNQNPTPIQTWTAIHYLSDVNLPDNHPIIDGIIRYLAISMDGDGYYPFKLPSNNDYPHAIWWHHRGLNEERDYNPSVALWAFLYKTTRNQKARRLLETAFREFIGAPKTEMHELKCFIDAYEWLYGMQKEISGFAKFGTALKVTIAEQLRGFTAESLKSYGPTPLGFCDKPESKLYPFLAPYIKNQIDALMQQFEQGGMWDINFAWGQYEEEFKTAKRNWQAIFATKYCRFM